MNDIKVIKYLENWEILLKETTEKSQKLRIKVP